MNQFRQRGKKLSPMTVLGILGRAKKGESVSSLAREYEINRATINRWLLKWGGEVEQLENAQKTAAGQA